ncbi:PAS domain S-box protein [Acidiphilium multivorum]|nr:Methyl-accepting chemotaxis sensory transducer [Acidiphilium sp. PM]MBS3024822.1 PAS domain S-box protein [Acidiphilium multivorum]MBU6356009.1 PAS domain S-box protein [Rhodospirillales bacterium]MDE2327408.1 PAS domain S-box protein [Rhodospirillales bacterium]UNC15581.1 PAS domain S-box protein [Acidiphilium multivorum]
MFSIRKSKDALPLSKDAGMLLAALQQISVPLFVLGRDGAVVFWNPACAELTGLAAAEVIGTKEHWKGFYPAPRPCMADLVLSGNGGQAGQLYAQNSGGQDGRMSAENWCDMPLTGRRRYLGIDAGPIRDAEGNTVFVVETLKDMTSAKQAELDLAAERERVMGAQAAVVTAIADGLRNLSAGILTFRITRALPAEYETLRVDFNNSIEKLQRTLSRIDQDAQHVLAATDEIARASGDLSQRTERQAASLEQTAAAVEQITATVRTTAQGAAEAGAAVSQAEATARHSATVVEDTVAAMNRIETSSNKITNIIGIIDEIAFQTNLLALNAGVEAARAGDAGRGFAVVATEVRALAQRSADAAREIKSLILAASGEVKAGVNLVDETGKALQRIGGEIGTLSRLMGDITASAREQATGLAEVNAAISEMDHVTQQNAAMAEQATAGCRNLSEKASRLSGLVGEFRIRQPGEAAPAGADAMHAA